MANNDNSGTLSRNKDKKEPNHADHRGSCMIEGKEYWINAWVKEGKYGKFFSLSFREKQPRNDGGGQQSNQQQEDYSSDIPF